MKKFLALAALAVLLTGCPSTSNTQRQQIAQASQNVSIVLVSAQKAEIASFQQRLIPAQDHLFIQKQFETIGTLGKTTDSCILSAKDTLGATTCINVAVETIDQINTNGGLYLKSDKAKQDFSIAMLSVRTILASISQALGGK